jgi:hypothetical protein
VRERKGEIPEDFSRALPTLFSIDTEEEMDNLIILVGKARPFHDNDEPLGFKNYYVFPYFSGELEDIPRVKKQFENVQEMVKQKEAERANGDSNATARQAEVNSTAKD